MISNLIADEWTQWDTNSLLFKIIDWRGKKGSCCKIETFDLETSSIHDFISIERRKKFLTLKINLEPHEFFLHLFRIPRFSLIDKYCLSKPTQSIINSLCVCFLLTLSSFHFSHSTHTPDLTDFPFFIDVISMLFFWHPLCCLLMGKTSCWWLASAYVLSFG